MMYCMFWVHASNHIDSTAESSIDTTPLVQVALQMKQLIIPIIESRLIVVYFPGGQTGRSVHPWKGEDAAGCCQGSCWEGSYWERSWPCWSEQAAQDYTPGKQDNTRISIVSHQEDWEWNCPWHVGSVCTHDNDAIRQLITYFPAQRPSSSGRLWFFSLWRQRSEQGEAIDK